MTEEHVTHVDTPVSNAAETDSTQHLRKGDFKSKGDWINQVLDEHCSHMEGASEAVEAVLDEEGKVVAPAKPARVGKKVTDLDALKDLAAANNITHKDEYPNVGMWRMNIGNMLRAAAKRRHGLNLPSEDGFAFTEAPADFEVNEIRTEEPDGTKIKPAKPEAEKPAETEAAE